MRKKLALGAIFSLVGFTIVATVLRGALLSEVFTATTAGKTFNIPWVWFWFHIEFCTGELSPFTQRSPDATIMPSRLVINGADARLTYSTPSAFIVACLVSFRSLFVHREQSSGAARRAAAVQRRPSNYNPYPSSGRTPQGSGNASKGNLGRLRGRIKLFQDSVLDTCRTLEGVLDDGTTLVEMSARSTQLGPVAEDEPVAAGAEGPRHPSPDEYEVERDSGEGEGVVHAVGGPGPAAFPADSVPRRWRTVSTGRLSLDSLYQREETRSVSPPTAESPHTQRGSIVVSEPSPLMLNPVYPRYPPWRRDSLDEEERVGAERSHDVR